MTNAAKVASRLAVAGAIVAIGGFHFLTRPVAAPSVPAETNVVATAPELQTNEPGEMMYRVAAGSAKASFTLGELLRGQPFTVVGTTDQVTADIVFNAENPSKSKIGAVRVNARTIKTDDPRRDGAISRAILKSNDAANEFIDFKPSALEGMPGSIDAGKPFTFKIVGELTIGGITKTVAFDGSAKLGDDGKLVGSANTIVTRKDFSLTIPNIPFVADVDDEVNLSIEFNADRA